MRYLYSTEREKLEHIKAELAILDKTEKEYLRSREPVELKDLVETILSIKGFPLDINSNRSKCYYYNVGFFVDWKTKAHPYQTHVAVVTDEMAREFSTWIRQERGDCVHNVTIKVLRAAWNAVADKAHITNNPWKKIKYVQRCETPTDTLSDEEYERIKQECSKRIEYRLMFLLSPRYTMRLSDACLRKWSDITPDGRTLSYIPHKIRRHGERARITVPVCQELTQLLSELPRTESPYLLPEIANTYLSRSGNVQGRIMRLLARAELDKSTASGPQSKGWHSLRVYSISKMPQVAPMATMQSIAGHLAPSQTQHYYRGDSAQTRKAIEAMGEEKPKPLSSADISKVVRGESVIIPKKEYDRLLEIERLYSATHK